MTRHLALAGSFEARRARLGALSLIFAVTAAAPRSARGAEAAATEAAPSSAQAAAAEKLFYEGRQLMDQKKYAEACPKLEQSLKLDDGIGTRFNLANCNEQRGLLASAYNGFTEVAAQAKAVGQTEREQIARKRASALESKVPKLVIDVDPVHDPSLEIRRDDVAVPAASWGAPQPVDAGSHTVRAAANGRTPWETTVTLEVGKTTHVAVPREMTAAIAIVPPAPAPSTGAAPLTPLDEPTTTPPLPLEDFPAPVVEGRGKTQRTIGYVIGGAGLVSLGVGGVFGLRSLGKKNDSNDHCSGNDCDADGVSLRRDAIDAGNVATATSIAGATALVTGLVLVLTAPKDRKLSPSVGTPRAPDRNVAKASVRPAWQLVPGGGSLGVEGVLP